MQKNKILNSLMMKIRRSTGWDDGAQALGLGGWGASKVKLNSIFLSHLQAVFCSARIDCFGVVRMVASWLSSQLNWIELKWSEVSVYYETEMEKHFQSGYSTSSCIIQRKLNQFTNQLEGRKTLMTLSLQQCGMFIYVKWVIPCHCNVWGSGSKREAFEI